MKHKIFYTSIVFFTFLLIYGCKKENFEKNSVNISRSKIDKIKNWVESKTGDANYQIMDIEGKEVKVYEKINWEESQYFPKYETVITPVSIKSQGEKAPHLKYLVIIMNRDEEVKEVKYFAVLCDYNIPKQKTYEIILKQGENPKNLYESFTGGIIYYDLYNNIVSSRSYDGGILSNKTSKLIVKKSKKQFPVENYAPVECTSETIDW
ncbi:MAG: hypothetical protein WAU23_08270 [Ferruginibacter sp.]